MKTFWGKFKNKYVLIATAVIAVLVVAGVISAPHIFAGEPVSQVEAITTSESPTAEPTAGDSASETINPETHASPATEETATVEQTEDKATDGTLPVEKPSDAPQQTPNDSAPDAGKAVQAPAPAAPAAGAAAPVQAPAVPAPAPAVSQPAAPAPAPEPVDPNAEYKALVYNMVKNWCPRSNILVNHQNVVSGNVYGWSWWGISTIAIRGDIPITITKDIALHECGHILQEIAFRPNPNTNGNQTDAINRLNAIYGTTGRGGIEANADCISGYLAPYVQPYSGASSSLTQRWNSECTGAKGDAAIKVVQGIRP